MRGWGDAGFIFPVRQFRCGRVVCLIHCRLLTTRFGNSGLPFFLQPAARRFGAPSGGTRTHKVGAACPQRLPPLARSRARGVLDVPWAGSISRSTRPVRIIRVATCSVGCVAVAAGEVALTRPVGGLPAAQRGAIPVLAAGVAIEVGGAVAFARSLGGDGDALWGRLRLAPRGAQRERDQHGSDDSCHQ